MIMDKLRSGNFVKWVMIVVVLTFVATILFAWGMDVGGTRFSKTIVAEIGDKKIPFNTFNEELVNRYKMEKKSEELSSFRMANLRDEIFQQMVAQYLIEKVITDLKLKSSPEELIQYFRTNPPAGIAQNPYFMTDSVFDTAKYYKFLDSPEAYNIPGMAYLESYHSQFTIPATQLQALISSTTKITDLEAKDKILATDEKAEVEYLFLPSALVQEAAVSEKDIKAYYDANPDSFKTEGVCELEYVAFPKTPSAADEENVRKEINNVAERLKSGESFEALAYEISEDASAKDSGDLGFFGLGQMVKPFEDVAFALKAGEVSEPVRTAFGYHLIKMIERQDKDKRVHAKHILLKVTPSVETVDGLKEKADTLVERLKTGKSFKDLAAQQGLFCQSTGMFEKEGPVPGFESESKFVPGLKHFGFNGEKDADVFENEAAVFAFHLVKRVAKGAIPFEMVKERISAALTEKKRLESSNKRMAEIAGQIKSGTPMKTLSDADSSLKYSLNAAATREAYLPFIGASSKAIYKAFALKEGECTPAMEAGRGSVIIRLIRKQPLSEADIAAKLPSVRQSLADQNRYMAYASWFEKKKEGLKIVNNVDAFYNQ